MALPESYTYKTGAIPGYFDAMLEAQPPERFSTRFLERLGFSSHTDRLFIGVLKDLGFLNRDGAPQQRYFDFLDRNEARKILADGIRESFRDLFSINVKANEMKPDEVKNKLRTLYAGKKTDAVVNQIASTFRALCDYADWSPRSSTKLTTTQEVTVPIPEVAVTTNGKVPEIPINSGRVQVSSLQYHINIVLPDTRDQSVYDAIFKSMREHLG